jgi:AcrR family transcriptional regulator
MTGREERKRAQAQFIRNRLVESAWGLIAARGAVTLTMDDVAREAGYSVGSLYNYFANKDELLVAVVEWRGRLTLEALLIEAPDTLPPEEHLAWHVRSLFRAVEQHGPVMLALLPQVIESQAGTCRKLLEGGMDCHRQALARLTELLARDLPAKARKLPLEDMAWILSSLIKGAVDRWFLEGQRKPLTDWAGPVVTLFLSGVTGLAGKLENEKTRPAGKRPAGTGRPRTRPSTARG